MSMPNIQLSAEELALVKVILLKHIPQHEVWVFGSRVTGNTKQFSDLDLVIFTHKGLEIKTLFALINDFTESNLLFKVDIVDWSAIDKNFKHVISQNHFVIQNGTNRISPKN